MVADDSIETLLVSKPVAPPWNDSGKNLVRDLVTHCRGVRHRVLSVKGFSLGLEHVTEEPLYGAPGKFAPALRQNVKVLARLLRPDRQRIYHFFFAPNPRTSSIASLVTRIKRRRVVQTVMSVPATFDGIDRLLFAERIVVLSESTQRQLATAGIEGVVHIPPGVDPPTPHAPADYPAFRERLGLDTTRPLVVFPGDYEFSSAAEVLAAAIPRVLAAVDATIVFACRIKRPASIAIQQRIREQLAEPAASGRVAFVGEIPNVRELLAAADVVVLPSESTYAKMDIPLVLLEALAESTPVVVADVAPLNEVLGTEACRPDAPVGRAVPPCDPDALAAELIELLRSAERREQLGAAGPAWVDARFHARHMGAAHEALYRSLAAGA